ncbi:hypothetical protein [Bacillus sp. V5-8f]|uniref:hypothetical protein n=1 Tax=Bacillus sp. V5-8f TaxID=2053044 RepID=UPI00115B40FE|nr:hypothetical protein [Bacillus sp. V5-8f]
MKPEIEELEKALKGFYNNVAAEHYEEWSQLDSLAIEISKQLKGKVDPVLLNKNMDGLEEKINSMEQILQGGDLS